MILGDDVIESLALLLAVVALTPAVMPLGQRGCSYYFECQGAILEADKAFAQAVLAP